MAFILSDAEIAEIAEDIREVVEDDVISVDIRYSLAGTTVSDWSPTGATIPSIYAVSSVSCFKGSYTLDEIEASDGLIEFSDVKIIFMSSSVSGVLSTDDKVAESGSTNQSATTYQIVNVVRDPLNICQFLQVRGI